MTDEAKTKQGEVVEEQTDDQNPAVSSAEKEKPADKTPTPPKKEKVAEEVESHETADLGKQLGDIITRLTRIEAKPNTRVYMRRREKKETKDDVQTKEEKPAGEPKTKARAGRIRLWRRL